jgi:hypothetical protein
MEGRINKLIDSSRQRRANESNLQGLAQQILDHLSTNNQPAARATGGHQPPAARACRTHHQSGHKAGRGRAVRNTSSRSTIPRSVSFSSVCACPGPGCSSSPEAQHPPAYSELNPAAPCFRPAHPQSRNTARRSRVPGGSSTNLCRPTLSYPDPRNLTVLAATQPRETVVLDTGLSTPVLLLPPDHFAALGRARDSQRSTTSPPLACSSPAPSRASTARPASPAPVPSPPTRCHSPIIEPDTSHIGQEEATKPKKQIELGFRVNIAEHLQHKEAGIDKSYDYSCSCLNRKSLCTCEEAVLEVSLRVRYHLFKAV